MTPRQYVLMIRPKAECRKLGRAKFGVYFEGLDGKPVFGPDLSVRNPDCVARSARAAWMAAFNHIDPRKDGKKKGWQKWVKM